MKKLSRALAVLMVATLSLSSVSASAAEVTEVTRAHERPAFSENAEGFKANFKFGTMRNVGDREKIEMTDEEKAAKLEAFKNTLAEKLSSGEITQEEYDDAIAKMESGEFTFGGKAFKGMKGERGENPGDMTEEEKAEMLENLKAAEGDKPFVAKFAGFPKAGVRMMDKPSAETENEA